MERAETVLVVGADGLIGGALAARLASEGKRVVQTTCSGQPGSIALDLSRDISAWAPPCPVAVAYLCAAVASQQECRDHPVETYSVNVTNTVALAKSLVRQGSLVVFPSSNLVFDGSVAHQLAEAPLCPRTVYGRQKGEVERQLLELPGTCVVRLTKVLGPRNPLLISWVKRLQNGEPVRPFSDMVMAPAPLAFAVEVLGQVGSRPALGVTQVSADEDIRYEAVARYLARRISGNEDLVHPMRTDESGEGFEHVPQHTTLDTTRLRRELGLTPPDAWRAIDQAIGP